MMAIKSCSNPVESKTFVTFSRLYFCRSSHLKAVQDWRGVFLPNGMGGLTDRPTGFDWVRVGGSAMGCCGSVFEGWRGRLSCVVEVSYSYCHS